MKKKSALIPLILCLAALASSCGYVLSSSPYGLDQPLVVSVPVAENPTRFPELGPMLTRNLINRLDSSPSINVSAAAPNTLKVAIKSLRIEGGSWSVEEDSDVPEASLSRVAYMEVEAILEKKGADGQITRSRKKFQSQYTYLVPGDQSRANMRRDEAFRWMTNDLGQKIAQGLLSEF